MEYFSFLVFFRCQIYALGTNTYRPLLFEKNNFVKLQFINFIQISFKPFMKSRLAILLFLLLPLPIWAKYSGAISSVVPKPVLMAPAIQAAKATYTLPGQLVWNSNLYFHQPFTDTNLCAGAGFTVFDSSTATYSAANIFTVQLSDANGSFSNAVNIGNFNSSIAVNISCTIPANTPSGSAYRIRVIASNPIDTSATNGKDILISNLSPLTASSNSPVCYGDSLKLYSNDTTSAATISWTTPLGYTINTPNPLSPFAIYADSGNYVVKAVLNACTLSDTLHFIVKSLPAAPQLNSNGPICAGDTLFLFCTDSTSNVYYNWFGPGAYASAYQNPYISNSTVNNSGTYILKVTAANNCSYTDSIAVAVNPMPGLPTASTNAPVCSGDSLKLFATDTSTGLIWFWMGPNGFQANVQNAGIASVPLADTGTYYVRAILNGCITLSSVQVNINPTPDFPSISSNSPVCVGNTIHLSSGSTMAGVQYNWKGPNGFSAAVQNPNITAAVLADSGLYKVYTTLGNCSSDTDFTVVSVEATTSPTVTISSNPAIIIAGMPNLFTATISNGGAYPSVQWEANGNPLAGLTFNPCYITPNAGDVISVYVLSSNSCANPNFATSNTLTVKTDHLLAGISGLSIYPNPSQGNFIVKANMTACKNLELQLFDPKGTLILHDKLSALNGIAEKSYHLILPAGTYTMLFTDGSGNATSMPLIIL
jgi:hypothetical protein